MLISGGSATNFSRELFLLFARGPPVRPADPLPWVPLWVVVGQILSVCVESDPRCQGRLLVGVLFWRGHREGV